MFNWLARLLHRIANRLGSQTPVPPAPAPGTPVPVTPLPVVPAPAPGVPAPATPVAGGAAAAGVNVNLNVGAPAAPATPPARRRNRAAPAVPVTPPPAAPAVPAPAPATSRLRIVAWPLVALLVVGITWWVYPRQAESQPTDPVAKLADLEARLNALQSAAPASEMEALRKELNDAKATFTAQAEAKTKADEATLASLRKELAEVKNALSGKAAAAAVEKVNGLPAECLKLQTEVAGIKASLAAVKEETGRFKKAGESLVKVNDALSCSLKDTRQTLQYFLLREDPGFKKLMEKAGITASDVSFKTKALLSHEDMNILIEKKCNGPLEYKDGKVLYDGILYNPVRTSKIVLLEE